MKPESTELLVNPYDQIATHVVPLQTNPFEVAVTEANQAEATEATDLIQPFEQLPTAIPTQTNPFEQAVVKADQRDATDARINELVDGTAVANSMSWKDKFNHGGERGVNMLVNGAKMSREEAVTKAAVEGHDVSHLLPKPTETITVPVEKATRLGDMPKAERDQIRKNMLAAAQATIEPQADGSVARDPNKFWKSISDKLERFGKKRAAVAVLAGVTALALSVRSNNEQKPETELAIDVVAESAPTSTTLPVPEHIIQEISKQIDDEAKAA